MGVSDWFSRRRPAEPAGNLLDSLIAAHTAQQYELVARLIDANAETIREQFPQWAKAPEALKSDPEAMDRYFRTLHTVARVFERAGDDTLMTRISGDAFNLEAARALIDQGRGREAVTLLEAGLSHLEGASGPGVQPIRAKLLGSLGVALRHAGDRRAAAKVTKQALQLCELLGDEEGVRAYTHNLDDIGTHHMAANDGTDATVSVVFHDEQGRPLTLDELRTMRGKVSWEVRGNTAVPPEASRLHQEGRAAGTRGDYEMAKSLLTSAAELAPTWAYPVYDRAYTHLLQDDFESALRDFQTAIELSPAGFFEAEVAVDTLTRESAGELSRGLYAVFARLEHMPQDERCSIIGQLLEKHPTFAPGWSAQANCVTDPVTRLEFIERGLAARPDRQTRGLLLINKAQALSSTGDTDGAVDVLRPLADSTSLNTRVWAEIVLATSVARPSD
jgi:tetratricopeptide (TPR) repeat protein